MAHRVWIYQDPKQVKKHGEAKASWYVGWYDPAGKLRGKSCGPGSEGHRLAERLREKLHAELLTGKYEDQTRKSWAQFKADHRAKILDGMDPSTRLSMQIAIDHFERLIEPKVMKAITTATFADYVAKRRTEAGLKKGTLISPATINKELRNLRAMIRKADKWGYLSRLPEFEFLKEPGKLPVYIPPDHFAAIYEACDQARYPADLPYPAADWWRGLLVTGYMTGWRIGQLLAFRRADTDLETGKALSRFEDNKGKRDQSIPLHPLVIEHLRKLPGFDPVFFPWNHNRRLLFEEFGRIQKAAGVKPEGRKERYGFHDIRRAFATMNADKLTPDALQALMQHKDYETTRRYINLARQLNPAVESLFVPDLSTTQGRAK